MGADDKIFLIDYLAKTNKNVISKINSIFPNAVLEALVVPHFDDIEDMGESYTLPIIEKDMPFYSKETVLRQDGILLKNKRRYEIRISKETALLKPPLSSYISAVNMNRGMTTENYLEVLILYEYADIIFGENFMVAEDKEIENISDESDSNYKIMFSESAMTSLRNIIFLPYSEAFQRWFIKAVSGFNAITFEYCKREKRYGMWFWYITLLEHSKKNDPNSVLEKLDIIYLENKMNAPYEELPSFDDEDEGEGDLPKFKQLSLD